MTGTPSALKTELTFPLPACSTGTFPVSVMTGPSVCENSPQSIRGAFQTPQRTQISAEGTSAKQGMIFCEWGPGQLLHH